MKKIALIIFLAAPLWAQTTGGPLNLNLPVQGSQGWGSKLNQNFSLLNSYVATIPAFPSSNGIVYRASSTVLQPAVFGNVVSLWTSCTVGYLAFDGTCSNPGAAGIGSITWSLPSFLTATPATISASGTQTFSLATQNINTVFAGPASGAAGTPIFRVLVAADLPLFTSSLKGAVPSSGGGTTNFLRADGTWAAPPGGGGGGTVTNVTIAVPSWASVTGSPITTSGTITLGLPVFGASGASHAIGVVPDPGASSGTSKYLREDGSWSVPPGGGGGGSPGGANNSIQYNASGSFGGDTVLTDGAGNWTGVASVTVNGTGGSILASGVIDGHTPTEVTTATSVGVGSSTSGPCAPSFCLGEYIFNNATSTTTFTLPTAEAGKQYCFRNATSKTNVIVVQTSGSGQFIDNSGVNTASGGNITSSGALGDSVCVVGSSSTQWYALVQSGIFSTN